MRTVNIAVQPMKRINKESWLIAGIETLADEGYIGVKIDRLCQRLQVTKGSFYHHYKDLDEYTENLLAFWDKKYSLDAEKFAVAFDVWETSAFPGKEPELQQLLRMEQAVRAWSVHYEIARRFCEKLDHRRLSGMRQRYVQRGVVLRKALDLARVEYACLMGIMQTMTELPRAELIGLSHILHRMLELEITNKPESNVA